MCFEKKIAFALFSMLVFVSSLFTVVLAEHVSGIVTADCLNVRSGPSTSYKILGQVFRGDVLNIECSENGWSKISFSNIRGYACDLYITKRVIDDCPDEGCSRGDVDRDVLLGQRVAEYCKQFLGTPYVYGGTSPKGFDCSGLIYYCYNNFDIRLNRVAADQMRNGTAVSKDELEAGDLVFFYSKVGSSSIGHVGMYVGDGEMIHSPRSGDVVKYESIVSGGYKARYAGARRVTE